MNFIAQKKENWEFGSFELWHSKAFIAEGSLHHLGYVRTGRLLACEAREKVSCHAPCFIQVTFVPSSKYTRRETFVGVT